MWKCPVCNRRFAKKEQPHSCQKVGIEEHFKNKEPAKKIFNNLLKLIDTEIGKCEVVSLPCCVHLFGKYDFLAALPKRGKLEIRFGLNRPISSPRIKQSVPTSKVSTKYCLDIIDVSQIDKELLGWLKESYHLKDGDIK